MLINFPQVTQPVEAKGALELLARDLDAIFFISPSHWECLGRFWESRDLVLRGPSY